MKKLIVAIGLVIAIGFTFTSCKSEQKETKEVEKEMVSEEVENAEKAEKAEKADKDMALATHQCPMDCEKGKTYDAPGQCPVCKMYLKEVEADTDAEGHDHGGDSDEH